MHLLNFLAEIEADLPITASYRASFLKMCLSLGLILLLLFATLWFLRKLQQGRFSQINDSHSIKIVQKKVISPKSMLYIIEVNGKQVLLAESQVHVKALSNLSELT